MYLFLPDKYGKKAPTPQLQTPPSKSSCEYWLKSLKNLEGPATPWIQFNCNASLHVDISVSSAALLP